MVSSVGDIEHLRREIIGAGTISALVKKLLLPSSDITMIARSFQLFLLILEFFGRESRDESRAGLQGGTSGAIAPGPSPCPPCNDK